MGDKPLGRRMFGSGNLKVGDGLGAGVTMGVKGWLDYVNMSMSSGL